jgi:ribosomal protein S18 acetylase RimI-like enzyme
MGAVRSATRRDLDRLVELWMELLEHHAPLDSYYRTRPGSEPDWRRFIEHLLGDRDTALFVWEEDGQLLGFCGAQVEEAPGMLAETARAEITDLLVRPGARRRGLGRELAEAALGWIRGRGVARATVQVAARNAEAQAFWRALGWGEFMDVLQRRL